MVFFRAGKVFVGLIAGQVRRRQRFVSLTVRYL